MNNRRRYRLDDKQVQSHTYYQTQKFLFEGEFESLNNDERMLYSILRDSFARQSIS